MDLPAPLVAADIDLSRLDGFMLDTVKLLGSELVALSTGDEFKAAVLLWCRSWKQQPACSLPDDDRVLASFAGLPMSKWRKVKPMALRGFVKCSDGRLYHKVLAQDAIRAAKAHKQRQDAIRKRWGKDAEPELPPVDTKQDTKRDTDPIRPYYGNGTKPIPTVSRDGTGRDVNNLPPTPRTNGTAPPKGDDALDIVRSFHALKQEVWDITPPPDSALTPKEISIVRAWVEEGVEYYPALDFMTKRMRRMSEKGEQPPERPQFFDRQIREARQAGWPGYSG